MNVKTINDNKTKPIVFEIEYPLSFRFLNKKKQIGKVKKLNISNKKYHFMILETSTKGIISSILYNQQ